MCGSLCHPGSEAIETTSVVTLASRCAPDQHSRCILVHPHGEVRHELNRGVHGHSLSHSSIKVVDYDRIIGYTKNLTQQVCRALKCDSFGILHLYQHEVLTPDTLFENRNQCVYYNIAYDTNLSVCHFYKVTYQ